MMAPQLQVLVVTMAAKVAAIDPAGYPPANGVGYVFSIQNPGGKPFALPRWLCERPDIETLVHDSRGICRNRNFAIAHATAPLLLMADDDLVYRAADLEQVIAEYDSHPDADFILWHAATPARRPMPPDGCRLLSWPRFYSPVSFEFSFRASSFAAHGLQWNEKAGIGAERLICGEEELMFRDLLAAGMCGYFIDKRVTTHPGLTTAGRKSESKEFIATKGALLRACRGAVGGLVRLPVEARRSPAPFFKALGWLAGGYIYACRNKL